MPETRDALRQWPKIDGSEDAEFVMRALRGDRHAFEAIVTRHLPKVLSIARRLTGNSTDAQDIAQVTFETLWRNLSALKVGEAGLMPWLARVATNASKDQLRRRRHDHSVEAMELPSADNQHRAAEEQELARAVDAALRDLPERQRAALVLFHYEQFSLRETAGVLDTTPDAVESLLARARRALKEKFQGRWGELRPDEYPND